MEWEVVLHGLETTMLCGRLVGSPSNILYQNCVPWRVSFVICFECCSCFLDMFFFVFLVALNECATKFVMELIC